ncbi:uncharacterized protein NPIL_658131 [Nephila pilipes]|uniref:Uncharacterized protein n=1 Tax=Nephila pilipes TaxID=299642 RepID=A0A8X6NVF4_NEPPI|nr:uncharacterized protein NPIL_658131 [Nephila pilipes]
MGSFEITALKNINRAVQSNKRNGSSVPKGETQLMKGSTSEEKSCVTHFILKSETLISQGDYQSILIIHEEISQVMSLANEFLPYPAFITVLCTMGAIFATGYIVAFHSSDDIETYCVLIYGVLQNILALLLLMIPAAGCNRSLILAQETIKSLPGWLPEHRKVLKMHIRQRHGKTFPLTLWNIYVIDESLLISAFGTLLTYGFLVGNIKNDED